MAATQEPKKTDFHADARRLLQQARQATIATSRDNIPYAALVTPAFPLDDPNLMPILLLSELSEHTSQLRLNPNCALLVVGDKTTENPQTAPRLCLCGSAAPDTNRATQNFYLSVHPMARTYANFADFAFWRLKIEAVYYIGGFAAAARLDAARLGFPPKL